MKHSLKPLLVLLLLVVFVVTIQGCENDNLDKSIDVTKTDESSEKASSASSVLTFDESSSLSLDGLFAGFPSGNLIQEHLKLSMAFGKDAEENYQRSLYLLRKEKNIAESLAGVYQKIPTQYYLYRTMIIEALKELRSDESLKYLYEIASLSIPRDTEPENPEIDTRTDEIIIRLTAVEGIGILAIQKNEEAEKMLMRLIDHEDLSVRQIATRSYLQTPFGNVEEKMKELYERLPQQEHWYITTRSTDIRKVEHPEMPKEFDIKINETEDSPKIR
ncbi:hypothetical protein [Aquimarina sp. 2201CG5-10]|uniref:hypothetical protein n=1 Tax=Aquimarina callyspongiae TaxID=3098150 RepID=UPI002AB37AF2|nr:hypothetical protein [Aquimarina sp. 2201CG5-10]MDY8136021.1 hypothetical protein [Aquimarina sp. 2201CG5-10]